jgi:NAD(P)-dependent dehydrogenase (short-subunit alcohol dehydrogenase family)
MMAAMNCKNAVCVITGAASGLGRAVAAELLRRGARIAAFDLAPCPELDAPDGSSRTFNVDVTDETSAKSAMDRAARYFGAIHVCLNCAGTVASTPMLTEGRASSVAAFKRVVDINLTGTFIVSCHAAEYMAQNELTLETPERGVIINVASVRAFEGGAAGSAYAGSKGAVVSMTLAAARELAPLAIRVNTIAPGLMNTPMLQGLPAAAVATHMCRVQFPARAGEAAEFADLACHMIENRYLNASTVRLDGGLRL